MKDSTTDRELLELAAKAAGLAVDPNTMTAAVWTVRDASGNLLNWNPLTDAGDALRLMATLRINVEHMKTMAGTEFGINCYPVGRGDCGVSEDGDLSDYGAVLRRAIVRAAAEIGRSHHAG